MSGLTCNAPYGRKLKFASVHRLVMLTFVGPCPEGMEVNHKNGNRADPQRDNLEYVTRSENAKHAYAVLGRSRMVKTKKRAKGTAHGMAKLSEHEVLTIRALSTQGVSLGALAKQYQRGKTTIANIIHRYTWRHI